MVRFLIRLLIYFAAAAVGLLVAALLVDGMDIDALSFIIDALIFAVLQAIVSPILQNAARNRGSLISAGVGLATTFIALLITTVVTDGLSISGTTDWFLATLIVWIAVAIASFLIPFALVKAGVEAARDRRR